MSQVGKSEYARHLGVSPAYVTKLIKEGRIILSDDGKHVELEKSDKVLGNRTRKANKNTDKDESLLENGVLDDDESILSNMTLTEARTLNAVYKARLSKIELDTTLKNLVSKQEVFTQGMEIGTRTRRAFEGISRRVAPELMGIKDIREFRARLDIEINRILDELVTDLEHL